MLTVSLDHEKEKVGGMEQSEVKFSMNYREEGSLILLKHKKQN